MSSRTVQLSIQLGLPVLLCLAWEALTFDNPTLSFAIGSPSGIGHHFALLFHSGDIWQHVAATLFAAIGGLLLGVLFGTATGIALSLSDFVLQLTRPYIVFVGSLPVFALGPVLIFWFGTGIASKIALVTIATYAVAVLQAYEGAQNANRVLTMMARSFGASTWMLARTIRIPSSVIWVLAGIRINIGMALVGAVVGEFISSQAGLGHLIVLGEGLYDMNLIWTGIISVAVLAICLNLALAPLEQYARSFRT